MVRKVAAKGADFAASAGKSIMKLFGKIDDVDEVSDVANAARKGATGAFNPGALGGGSGLGLFESTTVRVTQKGLDIVDNHLAQFGYIEQNVMMIKRLRTAMANGTKITGADASFYMHELAEATKMLKGLSYDAAHTAALVKYGVSPYSVYHPSVIKALPDWFNKNWRNFWGIQ